MLPGQSLPVPVPREWRELLEELAPVFARRATHRLFMTLACGLILADRGTATGMAAAAGIGHQWRRACWFFAGAAWDTDGLGLAVARLVVKYLLRPGEPLTVAVDGTFFRRWGRKVHEARWAYDGAAQGGKKIAFGNTWVVAAIVMKLPCCPSPAALPVLFRLWRGKGTASQPELAAELVTVLKDAFPGREVHGTGDAAFHGESLVIEGTTWTTRLPSNAVAYGPKPPPTGQRGRPRQKGDRIGKQLTGAGDACSRTQRAVERAVPFAFLAQSLMIIWYAISCDPAAATERRRRRCPWYRSKTTPAPADMHAALRGELLAARISGISPGRNHPPQNAEGTLTSEATAA